MDTSAKKTMQITMTDRPPVRIVIADWPTIARADWFTGEHECQANEVASLKVRRHEDGRTIIYGHRDRGPGGMPISYRGSWAGVLTSKQANIVLVIRQVACDIGAPQLADQCISELPAEDV